MLPGYLLVGLLRPPRVAPSCDSLLPHLSSDPGLGYWMVLQKNYAMHRTTFDTTVLLPRVPRIRCAAHPSKAYCTDTFGSTELRPVIAEGLSDEALRDGCDRVLNLLRLNFYMLDHSVALDGDKRQLTASASDRVDGPRV